MGNLAGAGGIRFGHRVLETSDNSPARKANMVPYLDFVVAINDVQLVRCGVLGSPWAA